MTPSKYARWWQSSHIDQYNKDTFWVWDDGNSYYTNRDTLNWELRPSTFGPNGPIGFIPVNDPRPQPTEAKTMRFNTLLDAIKWLRDATQVVSNLQGNGLEVKTKESFGLKDSKDFCDAVMAIGVERYIQTQSIKDTNNFCVVVLGSPYNNRVINGFNTHHDAEMFIRNNFNDFYSVVLPVSKD